MSQDEFTRLFIYVSERFDDMDRQFEVVGKRFDQIESRFDALHAKADIDETERAVINHQLDRHTDWIERASKKLGVGYDPAS